MIRKGGTEKLLKGEMKLWKEDWKKKKPGMELIKEEAYKVLSRSRCWPNNIVIPVLILPTWERTILSSFGLAHRILSGLLRVRGNGRTSMQLNLSTLLLNAYFISKYSLNVGWFLKFYNLVSRNQTSLRDLYVPILPRLLLLFTSPLILHFTHSLDNMKYLILYFYTYWNVNVHI